MELQQQQQHQHTTVDIPPVTGAPPRVGEGSSEPAGASVTGAPPRVGGEDSSEPAGDAPQVAAGDGGSEHSVGTQDLQTTRIVIDIGDNKTIEITLRGNVTLQSIGPQTAAGGGGGGGTAAAEPAPGPSPGQRTVLSPQAFDDKKYLQQMRGWLTTVATLFIGISFQAAMQPPSWIPQGWYEVYTKVASGAPTTMPAPSPSPTAAAAASSTITYGLAVRASAYVIFNTMTFVISLGMVGMLLLMKRSTPTIIVRTVAVMVTSLCLTVGLTFVVGNSYGLGVRASFMVNLLGVSCGFILYSSSVLLHVLRATRKAVFSS